MIITEVKKPLETVLLMALPASGKSEVCKFVEMMDAEERLKKLHLGELVQLDDFPYVDFMRTVDEILAKKYRGNPVFFPSEFEPFLEPDISWRVLIKLLNKDYLYLMGRKLYSSSFPFLTIWDNINGARKELGAQPIILDGEIFVQLSGDEGMNIKARQILNAKNSQIIQSLEGKTIFFEFARGGPVGAELLKQPIPYGYAHSLPELLPEILEDAVILYIWVTPEQAFFKNIERGKVEGDGNRLMHIVPLEVMVNDYGCDDVSRLNDEAEIGHCRMIRVPIAEGGILVPIQVFDNREDLTSFVRKDHDNWTFGEHKRLLAALSNHFQTLWEAKVMAPKA